ncbi:orotate phosphoribosyltransferase [Methanobacterium subterraneum]|jgi:orotate phosphoribosyltransferase|uniref:Orotate phosphoribosyltransferase n=1 Tax=Methanobacterium subterraneum TaxID=59277 RepID=A0A7K4DM53_9EURY|nr:orotate phosphoribosyltransferase [Methanobacterium subterraneum]MBW4257894.1 orotate phosphoribosyltransferase [Methanobacterium sp. YSL]NMO09531.1 orotate phosphoribosyltransferase [Methanobacterium subterraneum]
MVIEQEKNFLISLLKDNQVIQFGKFTLSSGRESDFYVDMKKAITDPEILSQVAKIISHIIRDDEIDLVAGPALGAVPIATAVALNSHLPMLMIRKAQKGYGTSKLIEGELKEGDRVIVVEDVTTTGNSLLKAVRAVQDNGGVVERTFVIVDREEGAVEHLKKEGVILEPLVSISDVK